MTDWTPFIVAILAFCAMGGIAFVDHSSGVVVFGQQHRRRRGAVDRGLRPRVRVSVISNDKAVPCGPEDAKSLATCARLQTPPGACQCRRIWWTSLRSSPAAPHFVVQPFRHL
jgi:hypothetical protein